MKPGNHTVVFIGCKGANSSRLYEDLRDERRRMIPSLSSQERFIVFQIIF